MVDIAICFAWICMVMRGSPLYRPNTLINLSCKKLEIELQSILRLKGGAAIGLKRHISFLRFIKFYTFV